MRSLVPLLCLFMSLIGAACSPSRTPTQVEALGFAIVEITSPTKDDLAEIEPVDTQPVAPTHSPTARVAPVLELPLSRGCRAGDRSVQGPQVGDQAVEFTLLDVHGNPFRLSGLLRDKPVVLIFGSFT